MKIVTDPLLLLALLLLGIWAIAALVYEGPGWVHALFTAGLFLLIYRIVVLGTSGRPKRR
jgi:membrane-bound ClpP family serine protease